MIKSVTQYVVICDNTFCDSVVKAVVDFHSDDRQNQFETKIRKLGWKITEEKSSMEPPKFICPGCVLFSSELENKTILYTPIKKSA